MISDLDPSGVLSDQIRPQQSYLRAANLEAHHQQSDGYIPTSRALEVLRRFIHSVSDPSSGRAWSLTGPYGAGKSSFALYLRALLGPDGPARVAAETSLRSADGPLSTGLVEARSALGTEASGFVLATATCQREPLADSLLRALNVGCSERWPRQRPVAIARAMKEAEAVRSARAITAAARAIAEATPLLLVLDEFGKTLEHFAANAPSLKDAASDLFVLQELAEQSTGQARSPIFTFTLQHLAFDDYVRQVSAVQRREWGKIQGRFEDVSFLESAEQSVRLVAAALDDSAMTPAFAERRRRWAEESFDVVRETGLANSVPGGRETIERCYPLHPIALLALPELCGQLGQHGRTLFTFIASSERGTARDFLENAPLPADNEALPTISLADLYDFFAGAGQALASGIGGSRWREVHERVREAVTLSREELMVLKSVGLLNLMGNSQGLRASADIVASALSPSHDHSDQYWRDRLEDLEGRGFLTFRSFASEYRLWQGSDVDLRGRVSDAREQLRSTNAADLLARLQPDAPIIAARHSQRVGMLRYFSVRYTDDGERLTPTLANTDPADGILVYHVGSPERALTLTRGPDPRPAVLVTSTGASLVREAAIEVAAALAVLDQQEVIADRVARRELQDRVADARGRLTQTLADTFRPNAEGVEFRILEATGPSEPLPSSKGLSRLLSDICDRAYRASPEVRNEMLGRRVLTSQGAKARRELIQAMIEHSDEARLAIRGYGPERAMYEAALRHTGLHSERNGRWGFGNPNQNGKLGHVWGTIAQVIDTANEEPVSVARLYARLTEPPLGLKDGPIPVLLTAFLLHRVEDVAIYEDGTFVPSLTSDVVERLVKAPQRFALKSFSTVGARGRIMAAVGKAIVELDGAGAHTLSASRLRNETVLVVAAPLLRLVRRLPKYSLQTSRLSTRAQAVRAALLGAREPDRLILVDLPAACGLSGEVWKSPDDSTLTTFSNELAVALAELRGAFDQQLQEVGGWLAEEFGRPPETTPTELRAHLRYRAEPLDGRVLDPRLRSLVFNAVDTDADDRGWLGAIGMALSDRAVDRWSDDDRARFRSALHQTAVAFQRVEAMHFDAQSRNLEGPFAARRLSLTTPEGVESSKVVYYDSGLAEALSELVVDVLAKAEQRAGGAHGRDGLAALLVEHLLGSMSDGRDTLTNPVDGTAHERAEHDVS